MFIKLNHQEVSALVAMIDELTDMESRNEQEQKAYAKLQLIKKAQELKYEARPTAKPLSQS